jgi:hypothetical protein
MNLLRLYQPPERRMSTIDDFSAAVGLPPIKLPPKIAKPRGIEYDHHLTVRGVEAYFCWRITSEGEGEITEMAINGVEIKEGDWDYWDEVFDITLYIEHSLAFP